MGERLCGLPGVHQAEGRSCHTDPDCMGRAHRPRRDIASGAGSSEKVPASLDEGGDVPAVRPQHLLKQDIRRGAERGLGWLLDPPTASCSNDRPRG